MRWVEDYLLALSQGKLVDLARGAQGSQTAASQVGIAPVRQRESSLHARGETQRVSCPCEKCISLRNLPIGGTIEVENGESGVRRLGADERRDGCRRREALVQEGDPQECTLDWGEERERGLCLS